MDKKDEELLQSYGWVVECESPFEIRQEESGSFASGEGANCVFAFLKLLEKGEKDGK